MARPPIRFDIGQALDVRTDRAPQFALDRIIFLDDKADAVHLVRAKGARALRNIHIRIVQNPLGRRVADAKNIRKRKFDALGVRNIHTCDADHDKKIKIILAVVYVSD